MGSDLGVVGACSESVNLDDAFDRSALSNAIEATIGDSTLPIAPLELQIAYKLYPGTQ